MDRFNARLSFESVDCDGRTTGDQEMHLITRDELAALIGGKALSYASIEVEDFEDNGFEYRLFSFRQPTDEGFRSLQILVSTEME